jgi:RNA polymerase sigma factor for flagellar operon FliA
MPLVYKVASTMIRRLPSTVAFEDLVSAGLVGLADALNHYEPARASTFRGYAEYRIRGEIIDELRRRDLLSRDARSATKRISQAEQELASKLGREADAEEVALTLGISVEDYSAVRSRLMGLRQVSTEDIDTELSHEGPDPYESAYFEEAKEQLAEEIQRLPRKQSLVLWLYYYEELPLRKIAEILGVTPPRICQIRSEALDRLRNSLTQADRVAAAA